MKSGSDRRPVTALTIAGSDSGGGAGIQADLKTFQALGVFGASVVTAVTAQNTRGVNGIFRLPSAFVARQLDAVLSDLRPAAVKTGMLGTAAVIREVARQLREHRVRTLVVDPVMISTSRDRLLPHRALAALKNDLLPLALMVTPNLEEAEAISGIRIRSRVEMKAAARAIRGLGAKAVVIKGGHLPGDATDLFFDGRDFFDLPSPRLTRKRLHGTGCAFSAALAAFLAGGASPLRAARSAKRFMIAGIENSLKPGRGAYTINWSSAGEAVRRGKSKVKSQKLKVKHYKQQLGELPSN